MSKQPESFKSLTGRRRPKKLVAAMSGGVDSSVAAFLMAEQGIEVIAASLRLTGSENLARIGARDSCSSISDIEHAREAAEKIGIEHITIDFRKDFERAVLEKAWQAYSRGETPNPCTICNRYIKFHRLLGLADELGAEGLITGHYARIEVDETGFPLLFRGKDPDKDQSYFLYDLQTDQRLRSYFPLGGLRKSEVRDIAEAQGFKNAAKRESQDACFYISGLGFPDALKHYFSEESSRGHFIDPDGKVLGKHKGIHRYTIGQRRGLGIALGTPAYVAAIDALSGNITLSSREADLVSLSCRVDEVNWILPEPPSGSASDGLPSTAATEIEVEVKVRSVHKAVKAAIRPMGKSEAEIHFRKGVRAVTPGQAAVFYKGEQVIGGGRIKRLSRP